MTGNSPPPGWYTDGQGGQRWWDGSKWYDAVDPSTEATAVEEASVAPEAPVQPTESETVPLAPQRPDTNADVGQRRKSPKASRPLARLLGSAIAITGIALAGASIVLLFMVNPDCLNNEECGELDQSYWDLFGIKSSALLAGLLLTVGGILLRRSGATSESTTQAVGSIKSNGITTAFRRKRVWIPVAALTVLALGVGTWAVVTAGPSDEEKQIASEKRASAAAAEAERQAEQELAQSKATCESAVGEFKEAVEAVDSKLDVGLVQSDFGNAVGDASVAHNSLDVDAISDDLYCLSKVAQPLEQAFNMFVRTNNLCNKCITN
jgi:hypothetical protein